MFDILRIVPIMKIKYEWIAVEQSVFFIPLILLNTGALNGDEHVVLIGSDQNLFIFSLDSEEAEIVSRVKISDHAPSLFSEKRYVLRIIIA